MYKKILLVISLSLFLSGDAVCESGSHVWYQPSFITHSFNRNNPCEETTSLEELKGCLIVEISKNNKEFHPVVEDYYISDTMWFYRQYKDKGIHTGNDYETRVSVDIHAPISGIIIHSDDSVKRTGWHGCTDGKLLTGGGNSIYMIGELDNKIYGFIFLHCQDVFVKENDFVTQDTVIGTTGMTGDTISYHVHVEMYYLGDGNISDYKDIEYDNMFNIGRHYTLYKNRCSKKGTAPCVLDSRDYLGE